MPRRIPVELAVSRPALLGEGPRWDGARSRLLWVDIEGRALHVLDPLTEDRAIPVGSRIGAVAPASDRQALVALADRLALVDLGDGSLDTLVDVPHDAERRLNDGACDARGRFWVGSMALDERPGGGALYRYADGVLDRVLDRVSLSNGIGWSPDGRTMYYVDSPERRVDAFDFDLAAGAIANRRVFVSLDEGTPDGLTVDDEGGVWVALWAGWCVRRYMPDGALDAVVDLPAAKVTACCFGGDDGRTLYVTTASVDLADEERRRQPHAGCVFAAYPGVSGPPANTFSP